MNQAAVDALLGDVTGQLQAGCAQPAMAQPVIGSMRDVRLGMYQAGSVLDHIRSCAARGLPMIETMEHMGSEALIVAPGPSLDGPLVRERIRKLARKGAVVIAIKEALSLLQRMGVQAHYSVSVDAKADQVEKTPIVPGVIYLVASCCHPALFDHLLGAGATVRVFHSVTGVQGEAQVCAERFPQDQFGLWFAQTGLSVANRAIACAFRMGCEHVHLAGAPFGVRARPGENPSAHDINIASYQLYANGVRGRMGTHKIWSTDRGLLDGRPWFATADMLVSAASVSRLVQHGLVTVIGDSLARAFAARPDLRDRSVQGVV